MATVFRSVPDKARSRPVGSTGRPLTRQLGGDDLGITTAALRLQRLRLLGIIGQRADLIAAMAWEVQNG